jgi:cell division protein FtsI/penicillin-binding protein 2
MDLNPVIVNAYVEGMKLVVNHPDGTAFSNLWPEVPVTVVGKTGTAEHTKGKSDHGAFVCFAPAEDPEIAIAVYVECGGHGCFITRFFVKCTLCGSRGKIGSVYGITEKEAKTKAIDGWNRRK